MKPQTFGRSFDAGKIVPIQCVKDDTLKDLDIKDSCFLLSIIYEGTAKFQVGNSSFEAMGPCFVCSYPTRYLCQIREQTSKKLRIKRQKIVNERRQRAP